MIEIQIEQMEQRITNLEAALHGLCELLIANQTSEVQASIDEVLSDHFNVSVKIGGFRRGHFDVDG